MSPCCVHDIVPQLLGPVQVHFRPGSMRQVGLQPSHPRRFLSSHCSSLATVPSPHAQGLLGGTTIGIGMIHPLHGVGTGSQIFHLPSSPSPGVGSGVGDP